MEISTPNSLASFRIDGGARKVFGNVTFFGASGVKSAVCFICGALPVAARTSCSDILPSFPVPFIVEISIPNSFARARSFGRINSAELELSSEEIEVVATGVHLMPEFGETLNEIKKDGFKIHKINAIYEEDNKESKEEPEIPRTGQKSLGEFW